MQSEFLPFKLLRTALALAMLAFHLYVVFFGPPTTILFRGTHLLFVLVLTYLTFTTFAARSPSGRAASILLDLVFIAISLAGIGYLFVELEYVETRFAYVQALTTADMVFGLCAIVTTLEAARRTSGIALPVTALAFILYGFVLADMTPMMIIDQLYLTMEGIIGIPLAVAATYIFLFVVFGALVEKTGAGKLFMDFALALAGGTAGGPAKVAVISSAMFGTISGSSTANVMTTGAFTIPLMKKIGYKPAFAGAVEAVASTGGQIMPPIMGAAAFVMAEFMGVSYLTVIVYALLPAFLYFFAVFMAVHFEARRLGLKGLPKADLPRMKQVLIERGHQILPLVFIVVALVAGYSPTYSATIGLLSVVPVALLRKTTRKDVTFATVLDGCVSGALNSLQVTAACACAGIVVGIVSYTGLGFDFSSFLINLAGQSLILALLLTALAGIILGMGLPTTPAYVVQAALLIPPLVKLGVAMPAAHMFVFYFAIISAITPPVAITLIAANGLSGASLWSGGLASIKLSASGYIVPFMFAYGPALLLIGAPTEVILASVTAIGGVYALSAGLVGHLTRTTTWYERLMLLAGAVLLIKPGLITDLAGLALILGAHWLQKVSKGVPTTVTESA